MKNKASKIISLFAIMMCCMMANAQNLKSNQERGRFLAKCYVMAKTVINYDKEATPSDIAKINRWAQNTLNGATSLIPEPEFLALLDSEMKKINNTPGYLGAQVKSCTTTLGGW